jgi:glycosyltransferase involved in cell wall biosynthesis
VTTGLEKRPGIRSITEFANMNPSIAHSADLISRTPESATGMKHLAGKRIGMVTYSPYPFDPRPRRAVDALTGAGAEIDLICLAGDNSPGRETVNRVNVTRIGLKHERAGKLRYVLGYAAFILISSSILAARSLRRRYDLIYVHNMPDILVASALVPKLLGAKVVLDLHDPMPELMTTIFKKSPESTMVKLLRRLEKWSIARANLVITVSLTFKRIFCSRSCPPEKMAVVMNSPDSSIFPFRAPQPLRGDEDGNRRFVVLYHGSLVERNGLEVAIEAVAQLCDAIPTIELRIVGSGTPYLERMMALAQSKGLGERVRYLGSRSLENLVTEIEQCDLGVIPNQRNPFTDINTPTRMFEYLTMGKPVIAPATSGIREYFSNDSLLFFEPGDARDLAKQIAYAFAHPREVREILERGQQVYLAHTWERERETLLDRVGNLLADSR